MEKSNRKEGYKKALAGVILAGIATLVCFCSLLISIINASQVKTHLPTTIVWLLFSFMFCILPLCIGISSISTYRCCLSKNGKPVPTLIMGIFSVVISGVNIQIFLYNLLTAFLDFYSRI